MARTAKTELPQERRRFPRVDYDGAATLVFGGDRHACVVDNLSPGGASVYCPVLPSAGENVIVYIAGAGRLHAEVILVDHDRVGLRFITTGDKQDRLIQKLADAMAAAKLS